MAIVHIIDSSRDRWKLPRASFFPSLHSNHSRRVVFQRRRARECRRGKTITTNASSREDCFLSDRKSPCSVLHSFFFSSDGCLIPRRLESALRTGILQFNCRLANYPRRVYVLHRWINSTLARRWGFERINASLNDFHFWKLNFIDFDVVMESWMFDRGLEERIIVLVGSIIFFRS